MASISVTAPACMSARMEEVLPAVASASARTPGRESPGQVGSRAVSTRSASRASCSASAASAGSSKMCPLATSCRPVSGLITALPTSLRHWRWRKSSGQCSFGQCRARGPNQAGGSAAPAAGPPGAALSPIQVSFSATTRWASPSRFTAEALTTSTLRAPAGSNPSRLPRPFCSRSTVASAASGSPPSAAAENGALQATTSRRIVVLSVVAADLVGAGLARERPAEPAGGIPEALLVRSLERALGSCRGFAPFAGGARSHKSSVSWATSGSHKSCSRTLSPSGRIRVRSRIGVSSRRRAMTVKPARCR